MTQDLTDFDETGKIRLQSDLNENTKLNMILESEMERKQSGGEWWLEGGTVNPVSCI